MFWKRAKIACLGTNIETIALALKFYKLANERKNIVCISALVLPMCSLFSLIYENKYRIA